MPTHGIRNLEQRLESLAFPTEEASPEGRAPLETYTVTSSEFGDVYRATDAYVTWLGSRIPGYGGSDRITRKAPSRQTQGDRGCEGLEVIDF